MEHQDEKNIRVYGWNWRDGTHLSHTEGFSFTPIVYGKHGDFFINAGDYETEDIGNGHTRITKINAAYKVVGEEHPTWERYHFDLKRTTDPADLEDLAERMNILEDHSLYHMLNH